MERPDLKNIFNRLNLMHEELTADGKLVNSFEIELLNDPNSNPNHLEDIAKMRANCERMIRENKDNLTSVYKIAIAANVDVDGSRLLRVYRFFYRNAGQINEHLRQLDLPKENQSLWAIIALTAIILIYAKI